MVEPDRPFHHVALAHSLSGTRERGCLWPVPPLSRNPSVFPVGPELPINTLLVVLDPGHPAGVSAVHWRGSGAAVEVETHAPDGTQDTPSIRALAVALLVIAHCRAKAAGGAVELNPPRGIVAKPQRSGWLIQPEVLRGSNWLVSLANAWENRRKDPPNAIAKLLRDLPGLLERANACWRASRSKRTFWCRNSAPAEVGAHAEGSSGPRLLFRRANDTRELPPEADLLALARDMEQGEASWDPLLQRAASEPRSGKGRGGVLPRRGTPNPPPTGERSGTIQQSVEEAAQAIGNVSVGGNLVVHIGSGNPRERTPAEPVRSPEGYFEISRILRYAPAELIGREAELKKLDDAWLKVRQDIHPRPRVMTFVAFGGEGKTALVAKWAVQLAGLNWPGCAAAFAWSFYNQGTRGHGTTSSDLFLKEALNFFAAGTEREQQELRDFAAGPASAYEKGQRLARMVGRGRNLLILDGLEPLQSAPSSPLAGELQDQGIAALLGGLATASQGLCLVTTRTSIPDLKAFWQSTAPEIPLLRLSSEAGVHLLKTTGLHGPAPGFVTLVEDVKGHALTLTLLGAFLARAYRGDIRQRSRIRFEDADNRVDGGHAFRAMAAYEAWLLRGGFEGEREVAVLRLLGLFDRPADAGCLAALQRRSIPGLTEPLVELGQNEWDCCLDDLERARLLTVHRSPEESLISVDAHPLLREYFARQLRERQPDAWRAANATLFEHLLAKSATQPANLAEAAEVVMAIRYGNAAGLHRRAFEVHFSRLDLDHRRHLTDRLGAPGAELEALSSFFAKPWDEVVRALGIPERAYVLRQTAMVLRATGRLPEADDCLVASIGMFDRPRLLGGKTWRGRSGSDNAVNALRHLAQLRVLRGRLDEALALAQQAVNRLNDLVTSFEQIAALNSLADIHHNVGDNTAAMEDFRRAEEIQAQAGTHQRLRRLQGYRYCDLLLTLQRAEEVVTRATELLSLKDEPDFRVGFALSFLVRGRAQLSLVRRESGKRPTQIENDFRQAIDRLRDAGQLGFLATGLIARAEYFAWKREARLAAADLNEALAIANHGPMPLVLADVHLRRVQLFPPGTDYPWANAREDLLAARQLVERCGYWRRKQELDDAAAGLAG